ncbi:hypothetical protein D8674_005793 [Pyrus ussuriensis x Pyrus communis]|uniref:Uncharacterized protein n=1 Tax=Pyrus ussuriensis x Pyrus communis TaxID=2448454 RepID=A0A5N5FSF3_9ROSA|nr:hypothetical protein D8674_005793 [Pyrus ussuriensis x Pyrus communis]
MKLLTVNPTKGNPSRNCYNRPEGVTSVAFKRANRDQLVITGDGIDAAGLVKSLRKKLGYADLLSVEEK